MQVVVGRDKDAILGLRFQTPTCDLAPCGPSSGPAAPRIPQLERLLPAPSRPLLMSMQPQPPSASPPLTPPCAPAPCSPLTARVGLCGQRPAGLGRAGAGRLGRHRRGQRVPGRPGDGAPAALGGCPPHNALKGGGDLSDPACWAARVAVSDAAVLRQPSWSRLSTAALHPASFGGYPHPLHARLATGVSLVFHSFFLSCPPGPGQVHGGAERQGGGRVTWQAGGRSVRACVRRGQEGPPAGCRSAGTGGWLAARDTRYVRRARARGLGHARRLVRRSVQCSGGWGCDVAARCGGVQARGLTARARAFRASDCKARISDLGSRVSSPQSIARCTTRAAAPAPAPASSRPAPGRPGGPSPPLVGPGLSAVPDLRGSHRRMHDTSRTRIHAYTHTQRRAWHRAEVWRHAALRFAA
jgi:hypothetical protein